MQTLSRRDFGRVVGSCAAVLSVPFGWSAAHARADTLSYVVTYFDAQPGSRSRDRAFDRGGMVWYCGQRDGTLTRLDPADGSLHPVPLGDGAAPHGVTLGPDGAMWVTEGGQNAIANVDRETGKAFRVDPPTSRQGARRVWSDSRASSVSPATGPVRMSVI